MDQQNPDEGVVDEGVVFHLCIFVFINLFAYVCQSVLCVSVCLCVLCVFVCE